MQENYELIINDDGAAALGVPALYDYMYASLLFVCLAIKCKSYHHIL